MKTLESMHLVPEITPDLIKTGKATRFGLGEGLLEMAETNPNVVVLDADLSKSTTTNIFARKYPERFFNIGIAEQNLMGVAGGLSLVGKIPYLATYGAFAVGRTFDQTRVSVAYGNLNVKINAMHGGISVGPDGATHQMMEDFALARVLPGMKLIAPCDYEEAKKAVRAVAEFWGPVVLRYGREAVPILTTKETPFQIGRAETYVEGTDLTIIACGVMVYLSLLAAQALEKEGVHARVINCHTIKPIDKEAILRAAQETGAIVTAEEHQVMAGFGSAVAEVVVQDHPVPMEFVGMKDRFGESGKPWELLKAFGMMDTDIVAAAHRVLERKK